MYLVKNVAHFIIDYCSKIGKPISNLKLQKMLYFLWIDFYNHSNEYLFNTPMFAWQFGPVVPEVYYEYCSYGGSDIDIRYNEDVLHPEHKTLLEGFIDQYVDQPVSSLVSKSHESGKPWEYIYRTQRTPRAEIPFSTIIEKECVHS